MAAAALGERLLAVYATCGDGVGRTQFEPWLRQLRGFAVEHFKKELLGRKDYAGAVAAGERIVELCQKMGDDAQAGQYSEEGGGFFPRLHTQWLQQTRPFVAQGSATDGAEPEPEPEEGLLPVTTAGEAALVSVLEELSLERYDEECFGESAPNKADLMRCADPEDLPDTVPMFIRRKILDEYAA
eukprot:gene25398-42205_t